MIVIAILMFILGYLVGELFGRYFTMKKTRAIFAGQDKEMPRWQRRAIAKQNLNRKL